MRQLSRDDAFVESGGLLVAKPGVRFLSDGVPVAADLVSRDGKENLSERVQEESAEALRWSAEFDREMEQGFANALLGLLHDSLRWYSAEDFRRGDT